MNNGRRNWYQLSRHKHRGTGKSNGNQVDTKSQEASDERVRRPQSGKKYDRKRDQKTIFLVDCAVQPRRQNTA
ncbi:MAG: hypothetical protein ACRC7O_08950, partial [Fimbriiglobus sp.]